MNNYFIILAAGASKRFNSKKPKQYYLYKNKVLYEHSLEKALDSKLFKKIILVVNNPNKIKKHYSRNVLIIKGGKERSDSSKIALKKIKKYKPQNVFIHDAARPDFSKRLLFNILKNLKKIKLLYPVLNQEIRLNTKLRVKYIILIEVILYSHKRLKHLDSINYIHLLLTKVRRLQMKLLFLLIKILR